jgi:uncharacterized protein (TIGR03435 family)
MAIASRIRINTWLVRLVVAATLALYTAGAEDAFEVASVKLADPSNPIVACRAYPGGRLVVTNFTLAMLAAAAYNVSLLRITGGPSWADEELFSITAKAPAGSTAAAFVPPVDGAPPSPELRAMLRTLLQERFGLRLHRETRRLRVLNLVVGKSRPKLQPARDPSADPQWPRRKDQNEWRSITMAKLAAILEGHYHLTVLDRTGLPGIYDFQLSYDPRARDTDDDAGPPTDPTRIPFKAALETQIGLRLEETKGAVDVLVIDEAKKPDAN